MNTYHLYSDQFDSPNLSSTADRVILKYNLKGLYMLTATLRNVGGSVMLTIPKSLLEGLGLTADSKVDLGLDKKGRIIIQPKMKPRYSLSELISQCDADAPPSDFEKNWDETPNTGSEVL